MAKIKERKSESWKPGIHQDDGFISKNKKRKEKRMSLNLSAKKIDTDEFIPLKKSSLLPFNKTKKTDEGNSKQTPTKFASPALNKQKQTPSKFSSPALNKQKQTPVKKENTPKFTPKGKKENSFVSTPFPKKLSLGKAANASENPSTPNKKLDTIIKSSLKRKAEEYIDDEAEEGEEPVTDKGPKPYVKGQGKKKSISFNFEKQEKSDSEEDDSDEVEDDSDEDSDEVTGAQDFIDSEASEGEETDDDDEDEDDDDDDDDEDDDSENDFKDFLVNDDEALDEEDSSSEDDSDSDNEEEKPQIQNKKVLAKTTNEVKKGKTENKVLPEKTLQKVKEAPAKKSKLEKDASQNKIKQESPSEIEKNVDETPKATSSFAGFAKNLPKNTTEEEVKSQLTSIVKAKNIVSIVFKPNAKKNRINFIVYLTDEDSLEKLLNKPFNVRSTPFKVYKARENPKIVKDKPVAFLPRVPLIIKDDDVKAVVEAEIGSGKILDMKTKNHSEKFQTRNILLTLPDEETLKKIVYKGGVSCNGVELVVRQAFESAFTIPMYKVVFSDIPEKTTEAILKKTLESSIGKGTVVNVKFSFRKQSFAFVTFESEEAQKKALEVGDGISLKGTKLKVLEYKPRLPKKRSIKKKEPQTTDEKSTPTKSKKPKNQAQNEKSTEPKFNQLNSPQKDKSPKNKNKKSKKAPPLNADKKANLSNKIEEKKKDKVKQFKKGKKTKSQNN